jgi:hypothetical protein
MRPKSSFRLAAKAWTRSVGGAGHAFEQHVALRQQRHEQQVERRILADDDAPDLLSKLPRDGRDGVEVHRSSPVSSD